MMKYIQGTANYYPRNLEEIRGKNDPESMRAVAREMGSLFAYELIKSMRATAELTSTNDLGKSTYMSMFDMELSRLLAERGGLQDLLLKVLHKDTGGEVSPQPGRNLSTGNIHSNLSKPKETAAEASPPPSMPVEGMISSPFGLRMHPLYGDKRFHYGVDIAAPSGTEIYPIKSGRVVYSGQQTGYGNVVIIDHGDGLVSKYAHNKINLAREGDDVDSDTIIAQVGETGNTTGPHVHLEINDNGFYIDPVQLIAKRQD